MPPPRSRSKSPARSRRGNNAKVAGAAAGAATIAAIEAALSESESPESSNTVPEQRREPKPPLWWRWFGRRGGKYVYDVEETLRLQDELPALGRLKGRFVYPTLKAELDINGLLESDGGQLETLETLKTLIRDAKVHNGGLSESTDTERLVMTGAVELGDTPVTRTGGFESPWKAKGFDTGEGIQKFNLFGGLIEMFPKLTSLTIDKLDNADSFAAIIHFCQGLTQLTVDRLEKDNRDSPHGPAFTYVGYNHLVDLLLNNIDSDVPDEDVCASVLELYIRYDTYSPRRLLTLVNAILTSGIAGASYAVKSLIEHVGKNDYCGTTNFETVKEGRQCERNVDFAATSGAAVSLLVLGGLFAIWATKKGKSGPNVFPVRAFTDLKINTKSARDLLLNSKISKERLEEMIRNILRRKQDGLGRVLPGAGGGFDGPGGGGGGPRGRRLGSRPGAGSGGFDRGAGERDRSLYDDLPGAGEAVFVEE